MNEEELQNQQLIEEDRLGEAAARYLTIYLGEPTTGTWNEHIQSLYDRNKGKMKDGKSMPEWMRNTVACAILLPTHDSVDTSEPENVLHKVQYWRQVNERDWFADLKQVVKEDQKIVRHRAKMLNLGVIEPIVWHPFTRQAYNWLYTRSEESGCVEAEGEEVIKRRMQNLVYAYGGAVVCGVFEKHSDWVKKIPNWKSGYFFEKLIYKVFTPEDMYKIKKKELEKASDKLVKSVRV